MPRPWYVVASLPFLFLCGCKKDLSPIRSQEEASPSGLPQTAILLSVARARDVRKPFSVEKRDDAPGGSVLSLPEGAGSPAKEGSASVSYRVERPGQFVPWVHCRWRDSCSNSVTLVLGGEERIAGEDHVFGAWHWVKTDPVTLSQGQGELLVKEREDGVEIDQLLLSEEPLFIPTGAYQEEGQAAERRLFADSFYRSPGHGMEAWDVLSGQWKIQFSLDPNRIPNQYALSGIAEEGEAVCLVQGVPWRGVHLRFALQPTQGAPAGFVLEGASPAESIRGLFTVEEDETSLVLRGAGKEIAHPLEGRLEQGQWHEVVVERWAWILRVFLDGHEVHGEYRLPCASTRAGLLVQEGQAYFDDFFLEEIQWRAEDGRSSSIPWNLSHGARWYRSAHAGKAIVGRRGSLSADLPGFGVSDLLIFCDKDHIARLKVQAGPLSLRQDSTAAGVPFYRWSSPSGETAQRVVLSPTDVEEVRLERIAFRNPALPPEPFRIGPYHFSQAKVVDPFDYLDFTQEELSQMNAEEKRDLSQRKPNLRPVVSQEGSISLWEGHPKRWRVKDGVLLGKGPDAVCGHSRRFTVDATVDFRIRMDSEETAVAVELYAGTDEPYPRLLLLSGEGPDSVSSQDQDAAFALQQGSWHAIRVESRGDLFTVQLPGMDPVVQKGPRGDGAQMRFVVRSGQAAFDDVEFSFPRQGQAGALYAFDRRETDWWRRGREWIDHGGITCVMASSWLSLVAPEGEGILWHKEALQEGLRVGFDAEAFTDWLGWDQEPNHIHHPYHNIRVCFSPRRDAFTGYRLEINADEGRFTRLYRKDVLAKETAQDASFPMVFVNEHNPYSPRRNHITATANAGKIRLLVNDQEVLAFQDADPIPVSALGVGGWNTRINLAHLEVASGLPAGRRGR